MEIFEEIEPLRAFLKGNGKALGTVGLVPTMGALHKGHLALIQACKAENSLTVCSIYVNPAQFNNKSDLEKYPRTWEADVAMLKSEGCDVLFAPQDAEMYSGQPMGFDFGQLDKVLEGKFRPGHFSGVALAVSKLFNIVQPDRAYFGQKDYQQLQVINCLKEELKFPIELRSVPIVRENSGLALSSRNQRLGEEGKRQAVFLFNSLCHAKDKILKGVPFSKIKAEVEQRAKLEPGVRLEYFELANRHTLQPLEEAKDMEDEIILIAAFVGEVRLIDNMMLAKQ
ncbi:MAG TPA: pantoate--beta-alanine ligase [Cyclobacteriaceae bacterium]|nr:pantoate--beta-alanine ligase [Cyclobacteriaceae bacterium]MCB9237601.1 pantoate--beta-alanine ligase [Flammeovirgaceae bacterium]MCB0498885.1 pantoate--beta-alanine ligase [Cyclobacteriaceae bacterium]MCO5270297.1 pantoate--beta-alanine ligase [Cyclobacteriaceae bacterium]MCW5902273.1 pantoate--beta-alanine ligase [Cyclobacteriaceae bacterium]